MKQLLFSLVLLIGFSSFGQAQTAKPIRYFMQQTPSSEGAIPYGNNPKAGKYVNAGDAKIYYEVYGEGEPWVILHGGLLGSTYEMHQFIDSLSKGYQVIAISTRGHGKSELGTEPLSIRQKADDILAVVKAVTSDSVNVLGFSDGGLGGYMFASLYPERVKKMIAIGAGEQTPKLRRMDFNAVELFQLDPAFMEQQLGLMPQPECLMELGNQIADFYNSTSISKELFGKIQCPVLIIAGENDRNAALETILSAYRMIPDSQLGIIPNAAHGVFLENFPAVWYSLVPFLEKE
ncbi:Pimeloyl-ACP methyl ester carboxylesterase [Algoriphagus alkaliphilus]|uniref:Pimeloyl-ACP methyl ester carboxylesterase n=1 Tax=Algoriphagus alkaliphilus TaxID=279824 RepID=A0A1G5WZM6_9BACT|nr:alpha/beta hydrolase [Algoriphagus alkaliphilus]MBA4299821.1 alpha/beta hydrolase [Cyclobacterium sp.]SDA63613.1 Pimeloyl-ACP methyl ester carboxylesterase [Algoriphagus alkaliphilus]